MERPGVMLMCAFVFSQAAATLIGVYGFHGYPHDGVSNFRGCGWGWALLVWIYSIIVYIPLDLIKMGAGWVALRYPRFFDMEWLPKIPNPFARLKRKKPVKKTTTTETKTV